MKKLLAILSMLFIGVSAYAQSQVWVDGYTRRDGTFVPGHYQTVRDNTNTNNWSTSGNTNPYTYEKGSRAKDYSSDANNYGSGRTIHTGPKGGQYYINSNGNKTYVPKQNKSTNNSLYNNSLSW